MALAIVLAMPGLSRAQGQPPNIIFFLVDDMGLQENSVPFHTAVTELNRRYRTIHVGKAHFGARGTPGENPLNLGFDVNIAGHGAGGPGSYWGEKNFSAGWRTHPPDLIKDHASGMPLHHGWHGHQWLGGGPQPGRRNFYPGEVPGDPNHGTLYRAELRAQMAAADQDSGRPEAMPRAKMVSTDGFGLMPDTVHYNADGQLRLGRAFAEAMKCICESTITRPDAR